MIESLKLIPEEYRISRDWQVIYKLLDYVLNFNKYDIDHFIDLINPDKCPDELLPYLASFLGYEYDYNETYSSNRIILRYYRDLLKNRGSELGLKLATALSVSSSEEDRNIEALSLFRVIYEDNKVMIYLTYPYYLRKLRDLIEVVRPAGVPVVVIPSVQVNQNEQIIFNEDTRYRIDAAPQDTDNSPRGLVSDKHYVGFGEVIEEQTNP